MAVRNKGPLYNLTYIVLEYIEGGSLLDMCEHLGGMEEDVGKFYLT